MSDDETVRIRILPFNGKREEWRMWSKRFLAQAHIKGYKDLLIGTKQLPNYAATSDMAEELRKKNDKAWNELLLSCKDAVSFAAVDSARTTMYPDGNCILAWQNLVNKYEPKTDASKVELKQKFNASKLPTGTDPDEWITELERIRQELKDLNHNISDEDLIIHIINNMTKEYKTLIERLES